MSDYNIFADNLKETLIYWGQSIREDDILSFYHVLTETIATLDSFKLYRYMSAEYYNIRNFEKERIHLSPIGNFNDIYEGLPANLNETVNYHDLKLFNDSAYACCFTLADNDLLMWSHYGNAHKGVCVEYDLKLLANEDIIQHIFPVIYTKKRLLHIDIEDLWNNLKKLTYNMCHNMDSSDVNLNHLLPLLITKGAAWKKEKEWRIVYTKKQLCDKDEINHHIDKSLLNIDFPCITGITLGFRIDDEIKDNIIEIVKRKNETSKKTIEIYQSTLSQSNYELGKKKVKID